MGNRTRNWRRSKAAFTLVEVLIGMVLLSIVFSAMTALLMTSIRVNQANINSLVAYNLAQEGLEGLRNVRDSHWLQNFGWKGSDLGEYNTGFHVANQKFVGTVDEEWFYRIYFNDGMDNMQHNPWYVEKLGVVSEDELQLGLEDPETDSYRYTKIFKNLEIDSVVYNHRGDLGDTWGEETPFRRYLRVEYPLGDEFEYRVRVECVVWWWERGRKREIELFTELMDWKSGYL